MALPLLISKQTEQIILPNDYKLGWLIKDDKEGYWIIWGSSSTKENALNVARQIINEKGEMDIYVSDNHLPKTLTKDHLGELKKANLFREGIE